MGNRDLVERLKNPSSETVLLGSAVISRVVG
jgi:hypothetical protein